MKDELQQLQTRIIAAIEQAQDVAALDAVQVAHLGRKAPLATTLKGLGALEEAQRKEIGVLANRIKQDLEARFLRKQKELAQQGAHEKAQAEWIDVTQPGRGPTYGHLHLVSQAIAEITDIFASIGFTRVRAPEIDWDYYAFESLNMPKDHPARDDWETFFVDAPEGEKGKLVLTPHTSNAQVREMEKGKMPIRMINIGRCFRRQSDVSHSPMFHQFEGLMVGEQITVANLKGVFDHFVHNYFGPNRLTRLRPHHFRFTEPSIELDISCDVCGGPEGDHTNCRLCKEGWLELGGSGMTHPNVLKAGGINPDKYTAFAFGWGVERTLMMKGGMNIGDIRTLYKNDLRFLKQF